ncbi:MAG: CPBP family glutamic-type intramembrane protease [Thermoproteus sp.]
MADYKLHVALAYVVLLAAYDVAADFMPPAIAVYIFAALETAFLASFRWVKLRYSSRGFYNSLFLFFLWYMGLVLVSPLLSSKEAATAIQSLYARGLFPILIVVYLLEEPLVSESIFRGILFQQISTRNRTAAYLASSLAYALLMVPPETPTDLMATALYFLLGLIFAYAYERGGFTSALMVHAVYSALYALSLVLSLYL